jgi:hypothetical protein
MITEAQPDLVFIADRKLGRGGFAVSALLLIVAT